MKSASAGLIATLGSRQFLTADLFSFTLVGGGSLSYTDGESNISWNSTTWSAGGTTGPYLNRKGKNGKCHWKVGLEVDTLTFDVIPGASTVNGIPFLTAVKQGFFDNAEFVLYRAIMPTYGDTSNGTVIMFTGRVGEVTISRNLCTFTINSHLELLNIQMPRNLCQANCVNTLFDASCTLSAATFSVTGISTASGSTASLIKGTIAAATGVYDLGYITYTSGLNNGLLRSIKTYTHAAPSTALLVSPFPNTPQIGDTFTITQGCDKKQSTCSGKFSNLANFRGTPYVPETTTAV